VSDLERRLVLTGQSVIYQDDNNRFYLETYDRLPEKDQEKYKKELLNGTMNYGMNEGKSKTNEIWPKSLGAGKSEVNDVTYFANRMKTEHELLNSNFFVKFYNSINGKFINELHLKDFVEETQNLLLSNIYKENKIIISRVLETNVQKAYSGLTLALQHVLNNGDKPLVELQLSPLKALESIASNESEKLAHIIRTLPFIIKKIPKEKLEMFPKEPKKIILDEKRGISYLEYITHLRHLWLYLGTVVFSYALWSKCKPNFKFYFGNETPSVRSTIALKQSGNSNDPEKDNDIVEDLFYIQMEKNGIGLDGSYYKVLVGKSDFDNQLREETMESRVDKSSQDDDFQAILADGEDIERKLFSNVKLRNALEENKLEKFIEKNKLEKFSCPLSKEFQIPSVVSMWNSVFEKIKIETESVDIAKVLIDIGKRQDGIELYLATIRDKIESEIC
jgi:hypothetical protein